MPVSRLATSTSRCWRLAIRSRLRRFGGAIEASFSTGRVAEFLKSLTGSSLRIRDFESVLNRGLLGAETKADYGKLGNADQGQIREFYLASLERVPADLRQKYFKLYAYY